MDKESQRWTARRKVELLLRLIKGETTLVDAYRMHDLTQSEVEGWMDTFLRSGERGLKARSEDEQATHEHEVRELRAKVGELVLELDARKKVGRPHRETRESLLTVEGLMREEGQDRVDRQALPLVRRAAIDLLLPPTAGERRARARRRSVARGTGTRDHRRLSGSRAAHDRGARPARGGGPGESQEDPPHPEAQPVAGTAAAV